MTLLQVFVLAVIQGLTEFLPVSSSAHLILGSVALGWPDQGLVLDLATHLGTLLAVLVYFRRDLSRLVQAWLPSWPGDRLRVPEGTTTEEEVSRLRWMGICLAFASVPALVAGGLLHEIIEGYLRDVRVIAWTTIVFGLLLWLADARGPRDLSLKQMTLPRALLIGLAQMAALVPGVSRSGITITAGRFLGFTGDAAARFSFLLSIPIIGAAGAYGLYRVLTGDASIDWLQFLFAVGLSAAADWICIAAFLALLQKIGLVPFVLYRLALGVVLLWLLN